MIPVLNLGKDNDEISDVIVKSKVYKTAVIVDNDTPISKLNHYIEGSSWKVDYFNQMKAENDILGQLDTSLPESLQQYSLIKDLELKVQSPIDVSDVTNATGSAVIAVGIYPQIGDLFIATLADGRTAILVLTEVINKSYNLNKVYEVNYRVDSFTDLRDTRYNNLMSKVVSRYYFDDNYVITDSAPILLEDAFQFKRTIEKEIPRITEYYFKECIDLKTNMLLVPGQVIRVLDPLLETFIFKIVDYNASPIISKVTRISDQREFILHDTIWGLLLKREITYLESVKKEFTLINRTGDIVNNDINNLVIPNIHHPLRDSKVPLNTLPMFQEGDYTYLFTSNFFDGISVENLSTLEQLTLSYLNNDSLSKEKIRILLESYRYWDPMEKYYYLPVVLILLKSIILKTHSII